MIRAMALGEVGIGRRAGGWRAARSPSGLLLGSILGLIGVLRIFSGRGCSARTGALRRLALTVGTSVVGVVTWGPWPARCCRSFIRRLGFDPASASAPFIATLVDVSGIVIYFSGAAVILGLTSAATARTLRAADRAVSPCHVAAGSARGTSEPPRRRRR